MENKLSCIQPLILGIGVPKAATTWIHRQLEAHAEISVTTTKEIGYWSSNYHHGPDWYIEQFFVKPNSRVFAEFTPHYLNTRSLQRISNYVDDARFIISLRNPYERAYSNYLHARRNGDINVNFIEACKINDKIIQDSCYSKLISTYLKYFELNRLHLILFEEVENDPVKTVHEMYSFIGVDNAFIPENLMQKVNVGRDKSASDRILKKLERMAKHAGITRKHLLALRINGLVENFQNRLARANPKPRMTKLESQYLDDILKPDIEQLSHLLKRDLSHWIP